MTKWQEFPIRPQGRPWTGINTRSGKLDDGSAQMDDTSINVIINRGDKLEKRKGLIRGIDERFAGSVCGLHRYTDECGREFLLVADEGGFSIRQPFAVPSFAASDAYPSDDFRSDGPVDTTRWTNTSLYTQLSGSLILRSGVLNGGDMRWFKDASNFSYKLRVDYTLDGNSVVAGVIKQSAGSARIGGLVTLLNGNVIASLVWTDSLGVATVLEIGGIGAVFTGSFELLYSRNTVGGQFIPTMLVTPTGGSTFVLRDLTTLNALADADLGQGTSVRIVRTLATSTPSIEEVQGEPI